MDAHLHPETLEETPPQFLSNWFYLSKSFIEDYGWYLLGSGLLLYYLLQKMRPYIKRWQEQQEERRYAALCHKNPDLVRARQEAMEVARLRMQVEHDERARIQAEKKKELEARKKEEYLARLEGSGPSRLGHQLSSDQANSDSDNKGKKPVKSSHRPDYNPLMGSGGSGGYRPARRTCPGGGCG